MRTMMKLEMKVRPNPFTREVTAVVSAHHMTWKTAVRRALRDGSNGFNHAYKMVDVSKETGGYVVRGVEDAVRFVIKELLGTYVSEEEKLRERLFGFNKWDENDPLRPY